MSEQAWSITLVIDTKTEKRGTDTSIWDLAMDGVWEWTGK